MRRLYGVVLVVLMAGLWSFSARAENRVALVVGNATYANTTPLANPLNDARDIAAALKTVGFEVVEALDADKRKLDAALRSFTEKLTSADVALFFYAGHGLQVGAQNYLVPVDAQLTRERDLDFEAVRVDFVLRQMEIERDGKTSIVILDACRDNPLSRNLARSMGTRSTAIGKGLAPTATGLGTFIAYATQPGNVALDGRDRNSPFTSALLKHMPAKGRSLYSTMIEVRKEVVATTNGEQVPWDHSALTGDFYFVPGDEPTQVGSVTPPPAATSDDMAAMKARLQKLEEEAKAREARPSKGAMMTADGIRLAELRARAANLEELVKDLQKRLQRTSMDEGRATNANEKEKYRREIPGIMMEWTRRGMDLKKMKEEIAVLEGKAAPADDGGNRAAAPNAEAEKPPVKTAATEAPAAATAPPPANAGPALPTELAGIAATRTDQGFKVFEGASLEGDVIKTAPADSTRSCMTVCKNTSGCTAANYLAKPGNTGNTCTALSRATKATTGISGAAALVRE